MISAAGSSRTLLTILAIVAGVACVEGACSLRSLDYLGNGHGQGGATADSAKSDDSAPVTPSPDTPIVEDTLTENGVGDGLAAEVPGERVPDSGSVVGAGDGNDDVSVSGAGGAGGGGEVGLATGGSGSGGTGKEIGSGGGAGGTDAGTDDVPASSDGAGSGGAPASGGSGSGGSAASGGTVASGGSGAGGSTELGGSTGLGGSTVSSSPVTTTCPGAVPSGITADWCSCAQWGALNKGAAAYYNDIWGSGPGPQCIWVAGGKWGATANHPSGGGAKSYPHIAYVPGTVISAIKTYSSSFDVTVPTSGAWEAEYDILVKNSSGKQTEIMLWMNFTRGTVSPASDAGSVSNVSVGGHAWDVSYSSVGENNVVSLLRTSNTNSGTVDIKAILDWIIANKNFFDSSYTLDQVQFGFQIVTDGAPQSFVVNGFSISSS